MSQIIVALDGMSEKKSLSLAEKLSGLVWGFKVNDLLFEDPRIIKKLKKFGNIFADAKLHDIPNTVSNSVSRLALLGADIITVHASGGREMMRAAKKAAGKSKIIAVTVLTSVTGNQKKIVLKLAHEAQAAKLDGIVCSAQEVRYISARMLKIVPGIRLKPSVSKDDQKRTATPTEALKAGASLLVVGRPITQAKDPIKIIKEINAGTA